MKKLDLNKKGKYLLGVSGGSDSMMLLDLCNRQGYDICVAHVNYRHRPTADRDENIVKKYCRENNIPIYIDYPSGETGNFQKWARDVRYAFYRDIYLKYDCDAILLGHQRDDYLENYLMAKERNSCTYYYGIRKETFHHDMKIIRPLLDIGKADTKKYCIDNSITYGDDESNFTDDYLRNRIRHKLVEPASKQQIDNWMNEINLLNVDIENKISLYEKKYDFSQPINIQMFNLETDKKLFMRYYLNVFLPEKTFSSGLIDELIKATESKKNGHCDIDDYIFVWEYGSFYLKRKPEDFEYKLNEIDYISTPYFSIRDKGEKIQQLTLKEDDWPITIRNYHLGDSIEMRYGLKKVNRFFIDRKISYYERLKWPVVENNKGQIIFVSGIGCDKYHFSIKPDLFVIK